MNKRIFFRLTALLVGYFFLSCKKEATAIHVPDFNQPNRGCLVSGTSDATGFGAYDLQFTYNAAGNPETFAGFLKISYDNKGRLLRQQNDADNYVQWEYADDNSFLPALSYGYNNGARTNTDIFTYDDSGRLVKNDHIYVNSYASGEIIWEYTYDKRNNIQTIIQQGTPVPLFQAKSYDDNPNFSNANQWIKYILNDRGSGYFTLDYLLFSANNATEWSIADNLAGFVAPTVNCYYKYNSSGFVISDSTVFHDPVNGDYYDIQTNSFKCQ